MSFWYRISTLRFPAVFIQSLWNCHPHASFSLCYVCLRKFSRVNQTGLVRYMSHKLRAKVMDRLNFVERLQIASQKGYSAFDTGRALLFLSQKYLTFCACIVQMSRKQLFWMSVCYGRKRAKNSPKWQKIMSLEFDISGTIHHMVVCGTQV